MFEKLKTVLGLIKFQANARLVDGTELVIEGDLKEGTKVYVTTDEGNIALPDGSYELDSNQIITVLDGVITNIEEKQEEAPEETPEVETQEDETPEVTETEPLKTDEILEKLTALETRLTELEEKFKNLETSSVESKKENEKLSKDNLELSQKVTEFETKLSKIDGAEPIKKKSNVESHNVQLSADADMRMKAIQKHSRVKK